MKLPFGFSAHAAVAHVGIHRIAQTAARGRAVVARDIGIRTTSSSVLKVSLAEVRSTTGVTVTSKVSTVVVVPSSTVTVIVAVPCWFDSGVAWIVQLPLPPSTRLRLPSAISDWSLLDAVTDQAPNRRLCIPDRKRQRRRRPILGDRLITNRRDRRRRVRPHRDRKRLVRRGIIAAVAGPATVSHRYRHRRTTALTGRYRVAQRAAGIDHRLHAKQPVVVVRNAVAEGLTRLVCATTGQRRDKTHDRMRTRLVARHSGCPAH